MEALAIEIKQEKNPGIKGIKIKKEEVRLSVVTNDIIEKPKESIKKQINKKQLELVNEFNNVSGYV